MLTAKEIARLLDVANAGVHKGEIALARQIYAGILEVHPDHAPTLISLAMSHLAVGEYEQCDTLLKEKVLAANPNDYDALAYLGLSAFLAGRREEADEILKQVPAGTTAGTMAEKVLESL